MNRLVPILTLTAALAAVAPAAAQSGPVFFVNRTDQTLTVHGRSYTDAAGATQSLDASWTVGPGQMGRLTNDGKAITARAFTYGVETADGKSEWTCKCAPAGSTCVVAVSLKNMADHWAKNGGKPAGRPTGAVYVSNPSGTDVQVVFRWSEDRDGRRTDLNGMSLAFARNTGDFVLTGGRSLVASKVAYELRTAAGTSSWTSDATDFDSDGDLHLKFDAGILARHHAATRPAAVADRFQPTDDPDKLAAAVVKVVGAVVAHNLTKQDPNAEPTIFGGIAEAAGRQVRDNLVEDAVKDVMPGLTARERSTVRIVIGLAADDKLNLSNLRAAQAKEKILSALRARDSDLGTAAATADFIYSVYTGLQGR